MKTTLTKLACLLMAGLLLVPTLAACSTLNDDGSKTKDPDQTTAQVEAETNPVENAINALRGKINWQGQDFGILYCNDYESYRREVEAQSNFTGEGGNAVLNDAINERNTLFQEYCNQNFVLLPTNSSAYNTTLTKGVHTGTRDFFL